MGNIVISLPHQPSRTSASIGGTPRPHADDTQSVTMNLGSSHPRGEAMEAEGAADDLVECGTIADALRVFEGACTTAMLAAYDRTTAPASLGLLRKSFSAAKRLRTMLMLEGGNLLNGHKPSLVEITRSLEENFAALEYALRYLSRHHGLAHMAEIIERGDADQASQEMLASLQDPHRLIVRDEATEAGVQAIREVVGPLNEILIALDVVQCIVMGRSIDDTPF
jgi:hypothetical protein